jgi:YbbR domain-containing protein
MKNGWSNLALRVVSLLLALTVWFFVSAPRRERVSERAFSAPLSIFGLRSELVITTAVPDSVSVRLRGRESDLRAVSSQNLEVPVDLKWATSGEAKITLRPQAINVPSEIEVVAIEPTTLHFHVEQLRQKVVAIRPFLVGSPPAGFMIGTPTADPDHALISGPASQVRSVAEVATERIIMTNRTEPFVQEVPVVSDSSLIRVINPQVTQVTVPVTVEVGPIAPSETVATETGGGARKTKKP